MVEGSERGELGMAAGADAADPAGLLLLLLRLILPCTPPVVLQGDEEIREVVGGKNAAPAGGDAQQLAAAAAAAQQQQAAAGGVPGAPNLGISDEQLAAMPPEVQARVRAAQALAAKMAAGGPPPAPSMPPPLPGTAAGWRPGMPLPGVLGAAGAPLPGVIPASAYKTAAPGAPPGVIPAAAFQQQQVAQVAPPSAAPQPAAADNPILAAAQAAARRLAQQAGVQAAAAAAQQPVPGVLAQPAMPAPPAVQPGLAGSLLQQMMAPGAPVPTAGAPPSSLPSSLLQQMMAPGAAVPGAPGSAAAAMQQQAVAPQPAKHFETELEINDFPQHARWKVGGWLWVGGQPTAVGCACLGECLGGSPTGRPDCQHCRVHQPHFPTHLPFFAPVQVTHRETIRDMGELGAAVVVKGK